MIRSIFTNFSSRLAVAVMHFAMLLMITHYLGKGIYGQISILALNVSIIHLISDLAGGPSLVYLTPRAKLNSLLLTGSVWSIFNSLAIGVVFLYTGLFPSLYGKELLLIGLIVSLHSLNLNLLLGQQRIKAYNILFFVQGILQMFTMIICIFICKLTSAYPYIYACLASNLLCYFIGIWLVHKNAPIPKIRETKSLLLLLFKNGFFTQAAAFSFLCSKTISFNSMKKILPDGEGAIGIFNSAYSLGAAIMLFGFSVASIVLSKVANQENHVETRSTVFRLCKLSFVLTAMGLVFFLFLPANFYSWLLGKDFYSVKLVFISMSPGILFLSLGTVFAHYFSGAGKHYMNFISGSLALLATYLTTDAIIRKTGLSGAGYSASIPFIVSTVAIFAAFMLIGGSKKSDWKQLLPSKEDFHSVRTIIKKIKQR